MSGGNSKPDPYHQPDPPKRSKAKEKEKELPKSYRDAVKPIRIVTGPDGRKKFIYRCEHCGKEKKFDQRKTAKRAFCDRKCRDAWQRYAKPPSELTPEGAKKISDLHKGLWADKEHREKRMKSLNEAIQKPEWKEKRKETAKEVASRPDWKKKQSEAQKGKKRSPETLSLS